MVSSQDKRGGQARKLYQLCAQVSQSISEVLGGECEDPVLQSLWVEDVRPMDGSRRLLVSLRMTEPGEGADEVKAKVDRIASWIRAEVAGTIHRKRVPELSFVVLDATMQRVDSLGASSSDEGDEGDEENDEADD